MQSWLPRRRLRRSPIRASLHRIPGHCDLFMGFIVQSKEVLVTFQLLFLIACISPSIFVLQFFVPDSVSTLIPHIWDYYIAGYTEAIVVALHGLFEVERMKCTRYYRPFERRDFILFQLAGWFSNIIFSFSLPSLF